jgi:NodT family efflux transporter outer membrane factor (OMF) lipoprotein
MKPASPLSRIVPLAAALALGLAAACKVVGRDYEPPAAPTPEAWHESNEAFEARTAELAEWWKRFEDPVLDSLIERAARQSVDVRVSLARIREARALRGIAASDLYPTVDATALYERRGESDNTPFGSFIPDSELYSMGLDAAWEIDLWGRVRRSVEAADADLAATVEDARAVAITIAGETAFQYVQLRAFQARIAIAATNVDLQAQTLALVRARFEAGLVGERDVAQATASLEATRSRVPELQGGLRAAENRLAVLLGSAPGSLAPELADARPIPTAPAQVAVGVPADIVRRRPDVRRAERVLAAETARIGVAEGELYPRLTLLGSLGLASDDVSTLFDSDSETYHFGPSVRWRIFDGGRLRGGIEAQDARTEQAMLVWEQTVWTALEESENAMTAFVTEATRRDSLAAATTSSSLAVELARAQYTDGLSDFQPVLDSQLALAELQDTLAQSEAAIATNLIALYKALGGGWEHAPEPAASGTR